MRSIGAEELNQIQGAGVVGAVVYGTIGFWTGLIVGGIGTCGALAVPFALGGAAVGFVAGLDDRTDPQVIFVYEQPKP